MVQKLLLVYFAARYLRMISIRKSATLTGHKEAIFALEASQDSNIFFSAGADGYVTAWDLKDPEMGQLIAEVPNSIYALRYDSRMERLIVGHNYDGLHYIDWKMRKETGSLNITTKAIFDIQVHAELCYVATGDGELIVVNLDDNKVVHSQKLSNKNLRTMDINPIRDEIAIGCSDNIIRILRMDDCEMVYELKDHSNSVFIVKFDETRGRLITGGRDAHLKIWDVASGYELIEDIPAHMWAINDLAFSPDSKHFVTCSMDKTIKVWDSFDHKLLQVIDRERCDGHISSVNKVLWSDFGGKVISCSDDRSLRIWNMEMA